MKPHYKLTWHRFEFTGGRVGRTPIALKNDIRCYWRIGSWVYEFVRIA